jgi:transposase
MAAGRHPAPACWTRSSRACTSAWTKAAATSPKLFREISALGYTGSYSTVRDYPERHRPGKAPLPPPPPTVREVTGWLTRDPGTLTEDEQLQLKALLERCPELQATSGHVRTFATMLTQLTGQDLPQWISDVRDADLPGLSSFAKDLEQDLDAVTQGLTSRFPNSAVLARPRPDRRRGSVRRRINRRAGSRYRTWASTGAAGLVPCDLASPGTRGATSLNAA